MFIFIPITLAVIIGAWFFTMFRVRGARGTVSLFWGASAAVAQFFSLPVIDQVAKTYFREEWFRLFASGPDAPIITGLMVGTAVFFAILAPLLASVFAKQEEPERETS